MQIATMKESTWCIDNITNRDKNINILYNYNRYLNWSIQQQQQQSL
jgi:hypothetical protein